MSFFLNEFDRPKRVGRESKVFYLQPWPREKAPNVHYNLRFSQVRRKK